MDIIQKGKLSKRLIINMKLFTAVLVYLFVSPVRHLSGTPITTDIKGKYGKTALDSFRRTEKLSYRSKKLQKDMKLLNLCKIYAVIPKFLLMLLYS